MQTYVISRAPGDTGSDRLPGLNANECRTFEDALAAALGRSGGSVLLVPHAYYLSHDHEAVKRLNAIKGDVVFVSWLHPRAAFWTLKANGVQADPEDAPQVKGRRILCYNMSTFSSADECAAALLASKRGEQDARAGTIDEISSETPPRWYPVLDYARCKACKQCLEFCLFDVYSVEGEDVVAVRPDNCKPGCPACARVCPNGAIMFPHYTDAAIAGAPEAKIADTTPSIQTFLQQFASGVQREPCPVCGCACDCERSTDGTAPPGKTVCPACGCLCDTTALCAGKGATKATANNQAQGSCTCNRPNRDDLDDLIDALDKLDD